MTKEDYRAYLQTEHWQRVRKEAKERAGYRCQLCGSDKVYNLEVHHNSYENLYNEKPEDVVVLCGPCHSRYHGDSAVGDGCRITIRSAEDHRALLLDAMLAVCDGRMSVPQANALVGLSAEVHKSIRQQWDMLIYAADNLVLGPGGRVKKLPPCDDKDDEGDED